MSMPAPDRLLDVDGFVIALKAPEGHHTVEWADGIVHAFDMKEWEAASGPSWRHPVVCGASGPGVGSDDAGHDSIRDGLMVTCSDCIGDLT
jgi:hypothetical protein